MRLGWMAGVTVGVLFLFPGNRRGGCSQEEAVRTAITPRVSTATVGMLGLGSWGAAA